MKARSGRARMQIVYVNSFGSHRCGSVIQYGGSPRGQRRREAKARASGAVERNVPPTSGLSRRRGPAGRGAGAAAPEEGCGGCWFPAPPGNGPEGAASRDQGPSRGGQSEGAPRPGESGSGLRYPPSGAGGSAQAPVSPAPAPAASLPYGGLQTNQADKFGFPFPSKVVNKVIKRKKKKSEVFHGVLKIISKMLEENEKFRGRLLTCSPFNIEVYNQPSVHSSMDTRISAVISNKNPNESSLPDHSSSGT